MNYLMSAIVLLLFVGVPVLKLIERQTIQKNTGEKILLEIKEKASKIKILLYVITAILVLFVIQSQEVQFYLAFLKLLFIIGMYIAYEQLKTRIYLTNKSVYLVKRFEKRSFLRVRRFKKTELYRVDYLPKQNHMYRLYFNGNQNYLKTLDVHIGQKDDLMLFRTMIKKNLDVYINEPVEIVTPLQNQEENMKKIDTFSKYFLIGVITAAFVAIGVELAIGEEKSLSSFFTTILAFEFIPFLLYLTTYSYLHARKKLPIKPRISQNKKELFFLYAIGGMLLPYVVLMNHGLVEGQRFVIVHLIGLFLLGLVMILAWSGGKIGNFAEHKQVGKKIEKVLSKIPKRKQKTVE